MCGRGDSDSQEIKRPVVYFSKNVNSYKLNYSVVKEALALIWALQHFYVYVGTGVVPLVVHTDHNPLTFLHSMQCLNQWLMRWCRYIQAFPLEICHLKGADVLSRVPSP